MGAHTGFPVNYTTLAPSTPVHTAAQCQWAAAPLHNVAPTTLMLRNLPIEYDRTMLLELLDAEGFTGPYDFLYLPADFRKNGCLLLFHQLCDARRRRALQAIFPRL